MLWPYFRSVDDDQESMMLVREGWKLVGMQTVSLFNGVGISKVEPLFLDTNNVKCQPIEMTGPLIYNIT